MVFLLFLLIVGYFTKVYFDRNPEDHKAFKNWVKKLINNVDMRIMHKQSRASSQVRYASSSHKTPSSHSTGSTSQESSPTKQDTIKSKTNPEMIKIDSLVDLYSRKSLSEGMCFIANEFKKDHLCCRNRATNEYYDEKIEAWMEEENYLYKEELAIRSKRIGNYDQALSLYNGLFEAKPWFPQTHYNAFKTLTAARQFNEAYRAIQLWCLAIIPHAVFQHPDSMRLILSQTNILDVKQKLELCKSLYLWSSSIPDAMYHLGNMGMLVSGLLSPLRASAYIERVSGGESSINFQQMEEGRLYGLDLVYELPWMSISDVVGGLCWSEIFTATQEVAKRVGRDSFRPPAS